jgi:predicted SprT family Zn-dependent metalloprotease
MGMNVEQLSGKFSSVRALARRLMAENGLTSWAFRFNKNLVRSGVTRRKLGHPGRIELSAYFIELNSMPVIIDTLKHEVAHAVVGPEHGHSEAWKAKCRELGCRPEPYYGDDVRMPAGRYQAVCPNCNTRFHRHRKPQAGSYHHEDCGRRKGRLVWERVDPRSSK